MVFLSTLPFLPTVLKPGDDAVFLVSEGLILVVTGVWPARLLPPEDDDINER
jgi:hypothetical protein